ncbi:hypothetical protein DT73_15225 [Mangrovibacter sp. MFB070]|uniref:hypothetical protein n=1 Tax=Mangrovibacter sp. MFB070 TaxID=1224318 RepID=UPI0004D80ABC|nr:hypothetical protein [Mangrovibacter sp. MFB070]KEA52245.1 hypothetical protein DT73_15225 [Mangrovibacter sp. MFB070]
MTTVSLKIESGATQSTPPKGFRSWLTFWEAQRGKHAAECEAFGCDREVTEAGRVIKVGKEDGVYILPLCDRCSSQANTRIFKAWDKDLVMLTPEPEAVT